ncbi:MAG TPA: hypothetical protein VJU59_38780 [Paraburkholderia sp.]|nr:hypothetical protein [Paraburkholderia sp.]HKR45554.1 hypothetical protein [Paraburkholderia sp.]
MPHGLAKCNFDFRWWNRCAPAPAPAFVLKRENETRNGKLAGGKPARHLKREPAGGEERRFHVLDPVRQLDARVERWWHREPFVDLRGFTLRTVKGIEQRGSAALFQSGTRQARYVIDRCASETIEPFGETSHGRQYVQGNVRQCA